MQYMTSKKIIVIIILIMNCALLHVNAAGKENPTDKEILSQLKNLDQRLDFLQRKLSTEQEKLARNFLDLGNLYQEEKKYDDAISAYNSAISYNPKYAIVYSKRGYSFYCKSKTQEALNDYTKAIELDPNLVEAYSNRGNYYSAQTGWDKYDTSGALDSRWEKIFTNAVADYTKVIELDPQYISPNFPQYLNAFFFRGLSYTYILNFRISKTTIKSLIITG